MNSATAALWLRSFFEKALVRRVKRLVCILMVRFPRSMWLVQIRSGSPTTVLVATATTAPGEYRRTRLGSFASSL